MRKFFLADRHRNQWRGSVNTSLTDLTSLGLSLDLNNDDYKRSPYGLQSAGSRALNLDLNHSFDNDFSVSLFGGREIFRSKFDNHYATASTADNTTIPLPNAQWQARMDDTIDTAGVSLRHKGMFGGRLELDADLVYVRACSPYQVIGGAGLPASQQPHSLPDVTSRSTELRLNARYALDGQSSLRVIYLYRRLASADFALDLYTTASLTRLLGTQESAPRFNVHMLGVSYWYSFR